MALLAVEKSLDTLVSYDRHDAVGALQSPAGGVMSGIGLGKVGVTVHTNSTVEVIIAMLIWCKLCL